MQNMIGETASIECVLTLFSTPPKKIGHCCEKLNTITSSPLFVFSIDGPKQNAGSLLTPVSDTVFYALSHGTRGFVFHGSFNNQLFQKI